MNTQRARAIIGVEVSTRGGVFKICPTNPSGSSPLSSNGLQLEAEPLLLPVQSAKQLPCKKTSSSFVAQTQDRTRDPWIFSPARSQYMGHVSGWTLPLLLCYPSLFWFLLHRWFCASPADPQRELNMRQDVCAGLLLPLWLSINRARLITSIGHGNNVGIKAEEGARMWHIRAARFSGTDLIQSGSVIWSPLNQSWRGESLWKTL